MEIEANHGYLGDPVSYYTKVVGTNVSLKEVEGQHGDRAWRKFKSDSQPLFAILCGVQGFQYDIKFEQILLELRVQEQGNKGTRILPMLLGGVGRYLYIDLMRQAFEEEDWSRFDRIYQLARADFVRPRGGPEWRIQLNRLDKFFSQFSTLLTKFKAEKKVDLQLKLIDILRWAGPPEMRSNPGRSRSYAATDAGRWKQKVSDLAFLEAQDCLKQDDLEVFLAWQRIPILKIYGLLYDLDLFIFRQRIDAGKAVSREEWRTAGTAAGPAMEMMVKHDAIKIFKHFLDKVEFKDQQAEKFWFLAGRCGSIEVLKHLHTTYAMNVHLVEKPRDRTALYYAAINSHWQVVDYLQQQYTDINATDAKGLTLLCYVCKTKSREALTEAVTQLVNRGASVQTLDENGDSLLVLLAKRGCSSAAKIIFEALPVEQKAEALQNVITVGHAGFCKSFISSSKVKPYLTEGLYVDWVKSALAAGDSAKAQVFWPKLTYEQEVEIFRALIESNDAASLELLLASITNLDAIKFQVDLGETSFTLNPLSLAAALGKQEIVEVLLDCGMHADSTNSADRSAAWFAVREGQVNVAIQLISSMSCEAVGKQVNLLQLASIKGLSSVIQALIEKGADVLVPFGSGQPKLPYEHAQDGVIKDTLKRAAQRQLFAEVQAGNISAERLALFKRAGADVNKAIDLTDSGDRLIHILLRRGQSVLGDQELLTEESLMWENRENKNCQEMIAARGTFGLMDKLIQLLADKFPEGVRASPVYIAVAKLGSEALMIHFLQKVKRLCGHTLHELAVAKRLAFKYFELYKPKVRRNYSFEDAEKRTKEVEEKESLAIVERHGVEAAPAPAPSAPTETAVMTSTKEGEGAGAENVVAPAAPAQATAIASAQLPPALAAGIASGDGAYAAVPSAPTQVEDKEQGMSGDGAGADVGSAPSAVVAGVTLFEPAPLPDFPSVPEDELDPAALGDSGVGVEESKSSEPGRQLVAN